jgi:imidazolonepropionase-like amidohydrolase
MMRRLFTIVISALLFVSLTSPINTQTGSNYEFNGGWWFDGTTFVRKKLYVVNGVFQKKRPALIDKVIELGDSYIVPPFGDAHSHAFDNPANIDDVVKTNLRDGIFYGLSLTNSIKGKRSVADKVNKPESIDVAYADAGLTATLGHPILSAEVSANHIPWDQLGQHWQQLLKSHTAEGDVYFVIDNLDDLQKTWPRVVSSKPDVIKIFLMDTEHFEELRRSTTTIDDKGLDPALVPAIVARAHRSKLRVAAHVETAADFRVAVKAGVDIIAHLPGLAPKANEDSLRYELTDADAALAKKKGAAVVATAWLAERLAAPKPWLSGAAASGDKAQLERAKQIQRRSLQCLRSYGVPIAIGPDLFEDAVSEAFYLQGLGVFDNRTLLLMWSRTTPQLIFPKRRIGQLDAGYEASFLALACDATADFGCTRRISIRMKQGRLLSEKFG